MQQYDSMKVATEKNLCDGVETVKASAIGVTDVIPVAF